MIFGVLLAGGVGSRMGNVEKPKQYMNIGDRPIIIHTIEKFFVNDKFEKILVLCPEQWISHTKNLIKKYLGETDRIAVMAGGTTRNETIMNAISYIEENIRYAQEYGACDTAVAATDTIVQSEDGKVISSVPDRSKMYQGQTPQTFRLKKLKSLYESLTDEEKKILTDAAKIFVMKGEDVYLVEGEVSNIKITYPYDLRVAETLIQSEQED